MLQTNTVTINTVSICQSCLNQAFFPRADLEAISENLDVKEWHTPKNDMKQGPANRLEAAQQLQANLAAMKAVLNNVKIEPYIVTSHLVAAIIGQMIQTETICKYQSPPKPTCLYVCYGK